MSRHLENVKTNAPIEKRRTHCIKKKDWSKTTAMKKDSGVPAAFSNLSLKGKKEKTGSIDHP